MSDIQRLLRVTAGRNDRLEYGELRVRLLKTQLESVRALLKRDRISATVLVEAVLRGYVERSPAVLAMVDQWRRDNLKGQSDVDSLSSKEISDIYASLGGGTIEEEEP